MKEQAKADILKVLQAQSPKTAANQPVCATGVPKADLSASGAAPGSRPAWLQAGTSKSATPRQVTKDRPATPRQANDKHVSDKQKREAAERRTEVTERLLAIADKRKAAAAATAAGKQATEADMVEMEKTNNGGDMLSQLIRRFTSIFGKPAAEQAFGSTDGLIHIGTDAYEEEDKKKKQG